MVCLLFSESTVNFHLCSVGTVRGCDHSFSSVRHLWSESQQDGEGRFVIRRLRPTPVVRVHTVCSSTLEHSMVEEMANDCSSVRNIGAGLSLSTRDKFDFQTRLLHSRRNERTGVRFAGQIHSHRKFQLIGLPVESAPSTLVGNCYTDCRTLYELPAQV